MKCCARCGERKPLTDFRSRIGVPGEKPFAYCRPCENSRNRGARLAQREAARLHAVGSVIPPADPVTQATIFAEAVEGLTFLYRGLSGALHMRRREARGYVMPLIGVYDLGCDWRSIAEDLSV